MTDRVITAGNGRFPLTFSVEIARPVEPRTYGLYRRTGDSTKAQICMPVSSEYLIERVR